MNPDCKECHEIFNTGWSIDDIVNHMNEHVQKSKDDLSDKDVEITTLLEEIVSLYKLLDKENEE